MGTIKMPEHVRAEIVDKSVAIVNSAINDIADACKGAVISGESKEGFIGYIYSKLYIELERINALTLEDFEEHCKNRIDEELKRMEKDG